jgi:hypothetical protein
LPPLPEDLPVFVAVVTGGGHPDRAGLLLSRHPVQPAYDLLDGLRVATPAEALMACARVLGLLDLVVLVDAALHGGDCSAADLREAAAQRRRGARLLRRALELADGRSESVFETLLRLLHVSCGIEVEPQRVVVDERDGFVARGDLWLVGTTTLHEYDGAHHLTRARQRRDLARGRRVVGAEWVRRGYTSVEVTSRLSTRTLTN